MPVKVIDPPVSDSCFDSAAFPIEPTTRLLFVRLENASSFGGETVVLSLNFVSWVWYSAPCELPGPRSSETPPSCRYSPASVSAGTLAPATTGRLTPPYGAPAPAGIGVAGPTAE